MTTAAVPRERARKAARPAPAPPAADYKRDLFAPRPVRRDTELGRLLLALEPECTLLDPFRCAPERPRLLDEWEGVPSPHADADAPRGRKGSSLPPEYCLLLAVMGAIDQPDSEPCEHCECAGHGVTLDDWAALVALYDPEGAAGPPADPEGGAVMLTHAARLATYARRALEGWAPRHPGDTFAAGGVGAGGVAGRRDVRGLDGGLVGDDGREALMSKADRDDALMAEVRAELAEREARRAKRKECAA